MIANETTTVMLAFDRKTNEGFFNLWYVTSTLIFLKNPILLVWSENSSPYHENRPFYKLKQLQNNNFMFFSFLSALMATLHATLETSMISLFSSPSLHTYQWYPYVLLLDYILISDILIFFSLNTYLSIAECFLSKQGFVVLA